MKAGSFAVATGEHCSPKLVGNGFISAVSALASRTVASGRAAPSKFAARQISYDDLGALSSYAVYRHALKYHYASTCDDCKSSLDMGLPLTSPSTPLADGR